MITSPFYPVMNFRQRVMIALVTNRWTLSLQTNRVEVHEAADDPGLLKVRDLQTNQLFMIDITGAPGYTSAKPLAELFEAWPWEETK